MTSYKISEIIKTLDKLFKSGINTTEKVAKLKWYELNEFTPFEKSLIMDFKTVIEENYRSNKRKDFKFGIVEFLAGGIEERKE